MSEPQSRHAASAAAHGDDDSAAAQRYGPSRPKMTVTVRFWGLPILVALAVLSALAAFYLPSVVFMDLYWRHLPYGKLRFLAGLVVLAAVSYGVTKFLDKPPRAIWEVSSRALAADKGDPAGCGAGAGATACRRAPILATLSRLRTEGQARVGLSKFARSCETDPMLETPEEMEKERYCFPAGARLKRP